MSGSGAVLGASTTAAGIILLPNTGGNAILTIYSLATIVFGVLVLSSFVASRIIGR
jgi:hypothetical protein